MGSEYVRQRHTTQFDRNDYLRYEDEHLEAFRQAVVEFVIENSTLDEYDLDDDALDGIVRRVNRWAFWEVERMLDDVPSFVPASAKRLDDDDEVAVVKPKPGGRDIDEVDEDEDEDEADGLDETDEDDAESAKEEALA